MNLGEFRNRLKQLKAYKDELERRLKRSPMRAGQRESIVDIGDYLPDATYPYNQTGPILPVYKSATKKEDGYKTKIKDMTDDEFYRFCRELEEKGRFDILQEVRAIRFNSAGW